MWHEHVLMDSSRFWYVLFSSVWYNCVIVSAFLLWGIICFGYYFFTNTVFKCFYFYLPGKWGRDLHCIQSGEVYKPHHRVGLRVGYDGYLLIFFSHRAQLKNPGVRKASLADSDPMRDYGDPCPIARRGLIPVSTNGGSEAGSWLAVVRQP